MILKPSLNRILGTLHDRAGADQVQRVRPRGGQAARHGPPSAASCPARGRQEAGDEGIARARAVDGPASNRGERGTRTGGRPFGEEQRAVPAELDDHLAGTRPVSTRAGRLGIVPSGEHPGLPRRFTNSSSAFARQFEERLGPPRALKRGGPTPPFHRGSTMPTRPREVRAPRALTREIPPTAAL